jgi:hypothetical protein
VLAGFAGLAPTVDAAFLGRAAGVLEEVRFTGAEATDAAGIFVEGCGIVFVCCGMP